MTKKSMAAIGECMLELSPAEDRTGDPVKANYQLGYGGDVFNTAVYAQRSGCEVSFVTATGDDGYSNFLLNAWQAEHIGLNLVRKIPGATPALYAIELNDQGERSFHYWRATSPFRQLLEPGDYIDNLKQQLSRFELVYFSGISLSLFTEAHRQDLLDLLAGYRQTGGQVAFDPNYRARLWPSASEARHWIDLAYAQCDIALPSLEDEQQLRNKDVNAEALYQIIHQQGPTEIVIKQGEKGAVIYHQQQLIHVPALPTTAVDTTAAGDAFNGAYLANRLAQHSIEIAAARGAAMASEVIQHPGAIIQRA